MRERIKILWTDWPFRLIFFWASSSLCAAPNRAKIIPAWELIPTAATTIRPLPSITWVPDSNIGSLSRPFFTWSDSPVRELSSTFRSLLWIKIPSAGNKSPKNNVLALDHLPSNHHYLPYLTWQISPTTSSVTRIWMTSLFLITENLCSCSIWFWSPGKEERGKDSIDFVPMRRV